MKYKVRNKSELSMYSLNDRIRRTQRSGITYRKNKRNGSQRSEKHIERMSEISSIKQVTNCRSWEKSAIVGYGRR